MGKGGAMNSSILIREITTLDLPEVLRLYAQPELDDGCVLPISDAEDLYARIKSYPNYKIYIALRDDKAIGTFTLLIMDNLGHMGAPSAIIEDVAVDPAMQRAGIGKEMMLRAIELAKEHGCYKAMVSSNARRSKAHVFYESLNFERHGYSFRIDAQQTAAAAASRRG